MDKKYLIRFWQKFFDQYNVGFCHEKDYMSILEEMIRGQALNQPSKTTHLFAEMYQKKLKQADCLGPQNELLMDKYKEALDEGKIDLQLLCSALSNSEFSLDFIK